VMMIMKEENHMCEITVYECLKSTSLGVKREA
jgi:hypothetical protein